MGHVKILGLLKRKQWPQCHRESSFQVRQSLLCQKEKKQSHLSKAPDRKLGESQGEREPHLGERREIRVGASRGKGGLHNEGRQVPRRKVRTSKVSRFKGKWKHERVSGR